MKFRTILSTILGRAASTHTTRASAIASVHTTSASAITSTHTTRASAITSTRTASIPGATLALAAALTLICACGKHGEEEWSVPSDLTGWVVYSSTDGNPVSFYSSKLVNGLIEYHYDQKANIGYVHVDGVPAGKSYAN